MAARSRYDADPLTKRLDGARWSSPLGLRPIRIFLKQTGRVDTGTDGRGRSFASALEGSFKDHPMTVTGSLGETPAELAARRPRNVRPDVRLFDVVTST
jgi:hypothetical protein